MTASPPSGQGRSANEVARVLATYLAAGTARELAGRTLPPVVDEIRLDPPDVALAGRSVELTVLVRNADYAYVLLPGGARHDITPGQPLVFVARESGRVRVIAVNALNYTRPVESWVDLTVLGIPDPRLYTPGPVTIDGFTPDQVQSLAQSITRARLIGLEIEGLSGSDSLPASQPARGLGSPAVQNLVGELESASTSWAEAMPAMVAAMTPTADLTEAFRPPSVAAALALAGTDAVGA